MCVYFQLAEAIKAINPGSIENAFSSFDVILKGKFEFPEIREDFFKKQIRLPASAPINVVFGNYFNLMTIHI